MEALNRAWGRECPRARLGVLAVAGPPLSVRDADTDSQGPVPPPSRQPQGRPPARSTPLAAIFAVPACDNPESVDRDRAGGRGYLGQLIPVGSHVSPILAAAPQPPPCGHFHPMDSEEMEAPDRAGSSPGGTAVSSRAGTQPHRVDQALNASRPPLWVSHIPPANQPREPSPGLGHVESESGPQSG